MSPLERISIIVPVRWRIFGLLFLIAILGNLQVRGLSIAAERMMPELSFTQMQIGWLEQAFVIGYAIFQIPGGVLGQRYGARWTMLGVGVLSFVCIIATILFPEVLAPALLFLPLLGAQVLFGIGQAPIYPVSTGVFEAWFQPRSWSLVQGLISMGQGLGGALAPPFVATLMSTVGWQQALLWTALPAIPLFLCWIWYARNRPQDHPSVSKCDRACAEATNPKATDVASRGLLSILRNGQVLLLAASYLAMNYVWYLLGNWCFLYLVQVRHFSVITSGLLAIAPPIAGGLGAGCGGAITSALCARFGARGLKLTPLIALPFAGVLLLFAVRADNPYSAVLMLTGCFFLIELTEGPFWAASMVIGKRDSMVVSGILNTGGNLGGVIGIPIVAYFSGHGSWNTAFNVGALLALVSALAWVAIKTDQGPGPSKTQAERFHGRLLGQG